MRTERKQSSRKTPPRRGGFTMLELQVAVLLLAFGMITMASLLTTQQRTLKKLRGDFIPSSTLYVTRSNDPWQQKMNIAARITSTALTQGAVPSAPIHIQDVSIVSVDYDLTGEGITVTADATPSPWTDQTMYRRPSQSRRLRRSGFTVLELLVVGVLGILVVRLSTDAAGWYVKSVHAINISAQLNKQLKLASEAIAQDMGGSLAMRTTTGSDLEFDIDDGDGTAQWTTPDTVVQYSLSGGLLLRHDLETDEQTVVAREITALDLTVNGAYLDVHIVTGYRTEQQDITLELRGS